MKVIGAGFGRTGTSSVKVALERLGFGPCHHMSELFRDHTQIPVWLRAAAGDDVDWDDLLGSYQSTVDWPAASFWRQLAARRPRARVLLTVRDLDDWYDSVAATIHRTRDLDAMPPDVQQRFRASPHLINQPRLMDQLVWQGIFDGRFEDRDHAIQVHRDHLQAVREAIPPGRLLEYDVSHGWAPLCRWLDVPEPDEPFPWLNTAADMRRRADPDRAGTARA